MMSFHENMNERQVESVQVILASLQVHVRLNEVELSPCPSREDEVKSGAILYHVIARAFFGETRKRNACGKSRRGIDNSTSMKTATRPAQRISTFGYICFEWLLSLVMTMLQNVLDLHFTGLILLMPGEE